MCKEFPISILRDLKNSWPLILLPFSGQYCAIETSKESWRVYFKLRDLLFLHKNGQQVLKDFKASLQQSLVTSSSFIEITDSKLKRRRSSLQLLAILILVFYAFQCMACNAYSTTWKKLNGPSSIISFRIFMNTFLLSVQWSITHVLLLLSM